MLGWAAWALAGLAAGVVLELALGLTRSPSPVRAAILGLAGSLLGRWAAGVLGYASVELETVALALGGAALGSLLGMLPGWIAEHRPAPEGTGGTVAPEAPAQDTKGVSPR